MFGKKKSPSLSGSAHYKVTLMLCHINALNVHDLI